MISKPWSSTIFSATSCGGWYPLQNILEKLFFPCTALCRSSQVYYSFQDLCAAFAPRYLAINEGGADELIRTVKRGYELSNAQAQLQISYCPKYTDPEDRQFHNDIPKYGLTFDQFYRDYHYVDVEDHSFRPEPSIALLKKCFSL